MKRFLTAVTVLIVAAMAMPVMAGAAANAKSTGKTVAVSKSQSKNTAQKKMAHHASSMAHHSKQTAKKG